MMKRRRKPGKRAAGTAEPPAGVALGLPKKHNCPDCHFCQMCSDSRCQVCRCQRESDEGCSRKMSFSEQIRLYEEINANDPYFRKNADES